jgi:hypothetical protein
MLRILSFILLTSCGLRSDDELFKNPLKGSWKLKEVNCYDTDIRGTKRESFPINAIDSIEIDFSAKSFSYNVSGLTGDGCIHSATGSYTLDFENTVTGLVSYGSISGASGTACKVRSDEVIGGGTPFDIDVGFLSLNSEVTNLYWNKDKGDLLIQSNSGYKGTPRGNDYCGSSCTCYNVFESN